MNAIVKRYEGNPILTKKDVPYPVETVHNAAVAKFNGRYMMLFRSHLYNGRSILGLAESTDGYQFSVSPEPFLTPATEGIFAEYEEYSVEDPRICVIDNEYLITSSVTSSIRFDVTIQALNSFFRCVTSTNGRKSYHPLIALRFKIAHWCS